MLRIFLTKGCTGAEDQSDRHAHSVQRACHNVNSTSSRCSKKYFGLFLSNAIFLGMSGWHFSDVDDASLKWLETTFLGYIASLKNESHPENLFSKETSHALVLVTITNVECVCFLLRKKKINYVLIWKFSSNPIEVLFGFLVGWTGIVSTSMQSKVKCSTSLSSAIANSSDDIQNGGRPVKGFFPPTAGEKLRELSMT